MRLLSLLALLIALSCPADQNGLRRAMMNRQAAASAGGSTLLNGLVASWKLDESSGNATDSKNSIVMTNSGVVVYAAGKINNGGVFLAASSQYFINAPAPLKCPSQIAACSNSMSITGWFQVTALDTGTGGLVGNWDASEGFFIQYFAPNVRAIIGNSGGNNVVISTATVTQNTWTYFALTWDGTTMKLSLNAGSQDSNTAAAPWSPVASSRFTLGSRNASGTLDGKLDEIQIWNRALTTAEITEDYNSGNGTQLP